MFKTVLVANRGEIACRILRTLKRLNIRGVAIYSEADAHSLHVSLADRAVCIGPAPAQKSYLDAAAILAAAAAESADAIHPGYGFLSENAEFAEACGAQGIQFIGPSAAQIRAFGLKHSARELAERCLVPLLPGSGILENVAEASARASAIGYPIILKSSAGGGGIGLSVCRDEAELDDRFESVQRVSRNNFAD